MMKKDEKEFLGVGRPFWEIKLSFKVRMRIFLVVLKEI
jgi:hypothetical protein